MFSELTSSFLSLVWWTNEKTRETWSLNTFWRRWQEDDIFSRKNLSFKFSGQHTELPPSKFQRKQKKSFRSRQATNKITRKINKEKESHKHIEAIIIIIKLMQVKKNIPEKEGHKHIEAIIIIIKLMQVKKKYSSEDRCNKCGDMPHVEGFRCPASRYQCKNCHQFGHFSSLCYKKKESEYKRESRNPRGTSTDGW